MAGNVTNQVVSGWRNTHARLNRCCHRRPSTRPAVPGSQSCTPYYTNATGNNDNANGTYRHTSPSDIVPPAHRQPLGCCTPAHISNMMSEEDDEPNTEGGETEQSEETEDVYDVPPDEDSTDEEYQARTSPRPCRSCCHPRIPGGAFCIAHTCLHCPRERRGGSYRCAHGDCARGDLSQP